MLAAIEALFLPALRAALGPDASLRSGPAGAPAGPSGQVSLWAEKLEWDGAEGEDPTRDPVCAGWQGEVSPDPASPLDFPLPEAARGEVAEVQSPPGRILPPGDAWQIDGRTLRFFSAPGGPVRVSTRTVPVRGYRERRFGHVALSLRAWAHDGPAVDSLLATGLAALLAAAEDFNVMELAGAAPSLSVRLTRPRLSVVALEQDADGPWTSGCVRCVLRGEVELALRLGEAAPEGRIRDVTVTLRRP